MRTSLQQVGMGLLSILLASAACSPAADNDAGSGNPQSRLLAVTDENGIAVNGKNLNGVFYNGVFYNGVFYNGVFYNGVFYNGVFYNGVFYNGPISNIGTDGVSFTGTTQSGQQIKGGAWVGATITGQSNTGNIVKLKIVGYANNLAKDPRTGADLEFFYINGPDGKNICGYTNNDLNQPIPAHPVRTAYDSTGKGTAGTSQYTFACRGGALQKCNEFAYPEWQSMVISYSDDYGDRSQKTISLAAMHQACVFMIRADYCGDGTPHTRNGTVIDIDDEHKLLSKSTSWPIEAKWGPDGAHCISRTRWMPSTATKNQDPSNPDWQYILEHCPWRIVNPNNPNYSMGSGQEHPVEWCGTASSDFYGAELYQGQSDAPLRNFSPLYTY